MPFHPVEKDLAVMLDSIGKTKYVCRFCGETYYSGDQHYEKVHAKDEPK